MAWQQLRAHEMAVTEGTVREAPRQTPVRAEVDVLVVGGGPAGVGAALAAAREGARTLLVERGTMLGGMWTAGLVNPFFEAERNGWLVAELVERLQAAGAWQTWKFAHTFSPEVMKRTLEAMATECGVELLYGALAADTVMEAGEVRGVIVESKAGREAILARVTVDCTGDGDVAARGGAPFEFGREGDGLVQPLTLMFTLAGARDYAQESAPALYDALEAGLRASGDREPLPFGRENYVPWVISLPETGVAAVQYTHVYRINPLDPAAMTGALVEGRRQVASAVAALRRVPGLEDGYLRETAAQMGVRESRRIMGDYRLDLEDLAAGRRFPDAVATCHFGVDIHEPAPGAGVPSGHGARMQPYEIPYRCLVPREVGGLLVAGRCLSGSHEAHASYRVTGTCLATGQAAGLAAAWASRDGRQPQEVDGGGLRAALGRRGVRFLGE